MKPSTALALALLALPVALVAPTLACDHPEALGEDPTRFPTFFPGPGYGRAFYGEYVGLPLDLEPVNAGETRQLVRGTVGLSHDPLLDIYVLVRIEQVETTYASGRTWLDTHRQTVFFDAKQWSESGRRITFKEKAPLVSLIGERATKLVLNKRTGEGTLRMRFWHGGRLFERPYSDTTHRFTYRAVDCEAPSADAGASTSGAAGALGALD
jgi:hypothetical protein